MRNRRRVLLARELVEAKVDVLVAFGIKALSAAKAATGQIPLVIPATSSDRMALGLIKSLARPGGNITGSTSFGSEVMAKRLEIVKDGLPRVGRVAVLVNPANSGSGPMFHKLEVIARALKLELQKYELRKPEQFASTFASISRARLDAVVVQDDTLFAANARALVDHAVRYRLPVVGGRDLVEAGGLVGFGRNELELYRASARYVDRILKAESPGDLPIDQAMRFEFWLNGGTAKALGILFPEAIRMRADNVIQQVFQAFTAGLLPLALRKPQSVRDLPTGRNRFQQMAARYVCSWVAGQCVRRGGVVTDARPGRLVRMGREAK